MLLHTAICVFLAVYKDVYLSVAKDKNVLKNLPASMAAKPNIKSYRICIPLRSHTQLSIKNNCSPLKNISKTK